MSTPLLFIRNVTFIFLILVHRLLALCRIGIHRGNGHRHWLHFVPAIRQGVKCERIDTRLAGTKCTRDFSAHEMVIFRRQELIILLRHPFWRLNVDPHIPPNGVVADISVTSSFAVDIPSATREVTSDDAVSTAFLSSATRFRFGSFRRFLTVGLTHFRRECIFRCDSGRGGENSLSLLISFRRPIGSQN